MIRNGAIVLLALAATACTTTGPRGPAAPPPGPPPPPSPPPAATIVGHGAYHTRSGARADCAGLSLALMHDTPSFRRRIGALYGSVEGAHVATATVKARSARLGPSTENTLSASVQCDGAGNFVFRGVSGGSYFIIGRLKVTTAAGATEDIAVMRHISATDGETQHISLAP